MRSQFFDPDPLASSNTGARLHDALEKAGIMLQTGVDPVVFAGEAKKDAGRPAVACDHDPFRCGLPQKPRGVILERREWDLLHIGKPC